MKAKTSYRLKMGFRGAVGTAGTLLCCLTMLTEAMAQGNQAVSFNDLLNGIKKSEKKLLNLRVDGKCLFLEWAAGKQDWQYNGESDVTAWYIGVPGSKVRVDIHKKIFPWVNGAAGFSQRSGTTAYNGRVGQHLTIEGGPADKQPFKLLEGQITADRPTVVEFASGWEFSLYGCQDQMKVRMSDYLEKSLELVKKQYVVQSSVNPVRFNDTDCIELVVQVTSPRGGSQKETWCFDPSRGYAILGYAILFNEETTARQQVTVEKLAEPVPGVYYPVKATSLTKDASGQPKSKTIYETSAVVANDPNFSDDTFTIKWPAGTVVNDKISGTSFTVGGAEQGIRDQVQRVKAALKHPLSPQPKRAGGYWYPAKWAAAIVVAAGLVTLFLWFTLKRRQK